MNVPNQVFVAPHSDDVALSCGGTVAMAARTGSPLIVTLFAGKPPDAMSSFARFQHDRWGLAHDGVIEQRRDEDRCAAQAMGSEVRTEWLGYLDAIYRDSRYDSDDALFGSVMADDLELVERIATSLEKFPALQYVVPLAFGNHVDHQIALLAGRTLASRGHEVWAYADMPYALMDCAMLHAPERAGVEELRLINLDGEAFERRWKAIECYASQIPVIFRDMSDPRTALERYARSIGGGILAEALWRIHPLEEGTSCSVESRTPVANVNE